MVRTLIVAPFPRFVGSILNHCRQVLESCSNSEDDSTAFPSKVLFLSALCIRLEGGLIEKLVVFSIKLFPTQTAGSVGGGGSGSRGRPALDDASEMQVAQRAHEARTTGLALLDRYVREAGTSVAGALRDGFSTIPWGDPELPEPTSVSPHVIATADALLGVKAAVDEMFGTDTETRRGQPQTYEAYLTQRKAVDTNIHKLFSDRIEIFGEIEFNPRQIIFATIKVVLKATSEWIRMLTLSKHGLQQMEVDIHLLGVKLWPLLDSEDNEQTTGTMLGHLVASATTRCTEPSPLSESIIRMICSKTESTA